MDHRKVIVHFAVSTPDQVARIKRLGAIVSGNPYYPVALADNYRVNGLDPARADSMVRMGNVRGPEQRVSRLGALKAVTLDAAYSLRLEKDVGSIVPGKLANFTVLADNPVTIDPMKIKDIKVWGTVQEGRVLPVQTRTVATASIDSDRRESAGIAAAERTAALDDSFSQLVGAHLVGILNHGH